MSDTQTNADRQAPREVWKAAREVLRILFNLFGPPEEIAQRHTLTAKLHAQLSHWLRGAEALMRRLIFIEAALIFADADAAPLPRRRIVRKAHSIQKRQTTEHDPNRPDAWRVSFRILSSPARWGSVIAQSATTKGARAAPSTPRFHSAWPLAERAEALQRAFNDPAPYARRLAARLRGQAARAHDLATSSWEAFRDIVGHTLHDALAPPIKQAARIFATNTS